MADRRSAVFDAFDEQADRGGADIREGHAHGREHRADERGEACVVEADEHEVASGFEPEFLGAVNHAVGDLVVAREDAGAIEARGVIGRPLPAPFERVGAEGDTGIVGRSARARGDRVDERGGTGLGVEVVARPTNKAEPVGGHVLEQVLGCFTRARGVVDDDGVDAGAGLGFRVEHDGRGGVGPKKPEETLIGLGDHERESVDEPECRDRQEGSVGGSEAAADQEAVALVPGFGVCASEEFGVELAVDVREDDAQDPAGLADQALRERVWDVSQGVDGVADLGCGPG